MTFLTARAGLLAATMLLLPLGAQAAEADPWTPAGGAAEAGKAATACLATARAEARKPCVRVPFNQCAAQHGRQTQSDLVQCNEFALAAWTQRLDAQAERIRTIAPAPVVTAFTTTQDGWRKWSDQDCAFQAGPNLAAPAMPLPGVGGPPAQAGTMPALETGLCKLRHLGERALELEQLADRWTALQP